MDPKKVEEIAAAKAKIAQQRGFAMARRADYLTICAVLKDNPKELHDCKQRLIDRNILTQDGEISPDYKHPPPAKDEEQDSPDSNIVKAEDDEDLAQIMLHRNYVT